MLNPYGVEATLTHSNYSLRLIWFNMGNRVLDISLPVLVLITRAAPLQWRDMAIAR
jgi:hypothetical protein